MDVEMPIMDGIVAVRKIMALCPSGPFFHYVFFFNFMMALGANLDALDAGAVDFFAEKIWKTLALNKKEGQSYYYRNRIKTTRPARGSSPSRSAKGTNYNYRAWGESSTALFIGQILEKVINALAIRHVKPGGRCIGKKYWWIFPRLFPYPIIMVQHNACGNLLEHLR